MWAGKEKNEEEFDGGKVRFLKFKCVRLEIKNCHVQLNNNKKKKRCVSTFDGGTVHRTRIDNICFSFFIFI